MRTKTLLLSSVLLAAGLATASAQVFSVNAVGYVNVPVPSGFSMIANPLNAPANTVGALFANAPDGTTIYKFNAGAFSINGKDFGEWANPSQPLIPGEGAFIFNAGATFTVTFVGEVPQGARSHSVPQGFSIQASEVPQSARLDTVLEFPARDGDIVYRFNNATGQYSIHSFDFGDWDTPPVPAVGESFFVSKVGTINWTRTFSASN